MQANDDLTDTLRSRRADFTLSHKAKHYVVAVMVRLEQQGIRVLDLESNVFSSLVEMLSSCQKRRTSQRDAVEMSTAILACEYLVFSESERQEASSAVEERVGADHPATDLFIALHIMTRRVSDFTDCEIDRLNRIRSHVLDQGFDLKDAHDVAIMILDIKCLNTPIQRLGELVDDAIDLVVGGWDEDDLLRVSDKYLRANSGSIDWATEGF